MDIDEVRSSAQSETPDLNDKACRILVVSETNDSQADRVLDACKAAARDIGLQAGVIRAGSCGCYDLEPILIVESPGRPAVLHNNVASDAAPGLINSSIAQDSVGSPDSGLLLFNLQNRIALRNCGRIDPENISHYIVRGRGYTGLSRALHMKSPRLGMLMTSAMLGRGGPGFSTAARIQECRESAGDKYVVCNAVDAGPGAGTGKLLLESDPHSVLEGMLISACGVGASHCILHINAGRGLKGRLGKALEQMRKYSLLGCRILDSEFNAEIEIDEVPDSLASLHRSELLRCIDEPQSMPHVRPIYPGIRRFSGGPAAVFNPETMAALSGILLNGAEERKGTKIVTLSGSARHRYTAEVQFGASIRSIIDAIGGGVTNGKAIGSVQLGGPAGTLIDFAGLDLQVGCAASEKSHSNIGSGDIQVFDTGTSAAEIAENIAARIHDQSCGRCLLCFEASRQILDLLPDIAGRGKPQDLNLLVELGEAMRTGCGCTFGRNAAEQFLSSLRQI